MGFYINGHNTSIRVNGGAGADNVYEFPVTPTGTWYAWEIPALSKYTAFNMPSFSYNYGQSMCYGQGLFLHSSMYTSNFHYSYDGLNWETGTFPRSLDFAHFCYNGTNQFAFKTRGTFFISSDGINWTLAMTDNRDYPGSAITFGDGKYVHVYDNEEETKGLVYIDENNYQYVTLIEDDEDYITWRAIAYGNGKFVAVGDGMFMYDEETNNNSTSKYVYSTDAIHWTVGTLPGPQSWYGLVYGNGKFVATTYGTDCIYSVDGINWTQVTLPNTVTNASDLFFGDGKFVIMNNGKCYYSTDAINWNTVILQDFGYIQAGTYGNSKFIFSGDNGQYGANRIYYTFCLNSSPIIVYTNTPTPIISDIIYSAPNISSSLTITNIGVNNITLSDNDIYTRNSNYDIIG